MSASRIGRLLVASLHQAIADLLPTRLEFYEHWLNPDGLREGTIGLAPLTAVLSFLRREGESYALITTRAGEYAADWSIARLPFVARTIIRALPASFRARAVLWMAARLVKQTYAGSRAIVRLRRHAAVVDLRGSLFCETREAAAVPRCGFYAAAIARLLYRFGLSAEAGVSHCRAAGATGCLVSVVVHGTDAAADPRLAA